LALMPSSWTFRSWNVLKSAFLAERLATHTGAKSTP
jgi:hypothetical protein